MVVRFIVYSLSFIVLFLILTIYDIRYTIYASESTSSARPLTTASPLAEPREAARERSDGDRAQVVDIGYSRIDPSSPLYFLKSVRENIEMKLAQTPRVKDLRHLEFATRRLREARTLIGKNEDLIAPTLERYIAHLKNLSDIRAYSEQQIADDVRNNLSIHLKILEKMYDESQTLRAKIFIRSTLNRLIKRADVSKKDKLIVCDLFDKEASSSALNDTEKYVLKNRAQDCFKETAF